MSANVRLVARAAERDAHVLASERTRDRLGDRRLANSRRSDEEQNRTLRHGLGLGFLLVGDRLVFIVANGKRRCCFILVGLQYRSRKLSLALNFLGKLLRPKLANGEEFQHAILHVGETVVVFIENHRRVVQIELIVRPRVPRQLGDPLRDTCE